ncbi:MAG: hypothetical protein ACOH2F_03975 [Cellulomonas sp.]
MLAIAVLVPDTALLVPGAAGRAVVLPDVRARALDAVGELVRTRPDRVVVVAPGPSDRTFAGPGHVSLAAAGIDDAALGWSASSLSSAGPGASDDDQPAACVPAVGAAVALLLLAHAAWAGPVTVVEIAAPVAAEPVQAGRHELGETLRARGADLVAGTDRVALIVAGSLSARDGAHAPHAEDERAAPFDTAMLADLALGDSPARHRLAAIGADLAVELVVNAWAPVQVLLGAAGEVPLEAEVLDASAPYGVPYVVAVWRTAPGPLPLGGGR